MKTALAATLVLFAVLAARRVLACECGGEFASVVLPLDGATDVPTDADIWTLGRNGTIAVVTLDGRALVPVETLDLDAGALRRWDAGELNPSTPHVVDFSQSESCEPEMTCTRTSFTTIDGPGVAPTIPEVVSARWHEEGGGLFGGTTSCGDAAFFQVSVDVEAGTLLLVDLAPLGGDSFVAADLAAPVHSDGASNFVIGDSFCTDNWNFDNKERAPFRIGALDAAGRFSGWSEREQVEAPGCHGGGSIGGLSGSIGLIGLLLVRLVRRRTADHEALVPAAARAHDRYRLR